MSQRNLSVLLCWFAVGCAALNESSREEERDPKLEEARVRCLTGKGKERLADCFTVKHRRPMDVEVHHRLGLLLLEQGSVPQGVVHLKRALELAPNQFQIWLEIAAAMEKRGDIAEYHRSLSKAIEIKPDLVDVRIELCVSLRKNGMRAEAEKCLRDTIAANTNSAASWAQLSVTLDQLGRKDESIEAGRKAVQLRPDDPNVHSNLGLFMTNAGMVEEAIVQLKAAVDLDPANATAQYNLALAYTKADALEEAARVYLQALKNRGNFREAHHNLAVVLMGLGLCKTSEFHFLEAERQGVHRSDVLKEHYRKMCSPPEEVAPAPAK